jgi:hypothetical protein
MIKTAREQFIEDFLLVAENDYGFYMQHVEICKREGTAKCGEIIQAEFEGWINSLADEEDERGNEFGAVLIRQLLVGWGNDTFHKIAERFQEDN